MQNNGQFFKVDLAAKDCIIIGPKTVLDTYRGKTSKASEAVQKRFVNTKSLTKEQHKFFGL